MSREEFVCYCCGASGIDEAREYSRGGFTALVCVNCGSFHDFSGFQEATEWSLEFINF